LDSHPRVIRQSHGLNGAKNAAFKDGFNCSHKSPSGLSRFNDRNYS
jgi:hypothetical protein